MTTHRCGTTLDDAYLAIVAFLGLFLIATAIGLLTGLIE